MDQYTSQAHRRDTEDAASYREMMAGIDVSGYDQNAQLRTAQRSGMDTKLTEAVATSEPQNLSGSARQAVSAVRDVVGRRAIDIETTAVKVRDILTNEREYPVARTQDADKVLNDARSALDGSAEVFEAVYGAAEYALREEARPRVASGDEASARTDAVMLLNGAEGMEITKRIRDHVDSREDSVSGLISDPSWLSMYLTGRGITGDQATAIMRATTAYVSDAAKRSNNPNRRAAGNALSSLSNYRAAFDATRGMANTIDPRPKR